MQKRPVILRSLLIVATPYTRACARYQMYDASRAKGSKTREVLVIYMCDICVIYIGANTAGFGSKCGRFGPPGSNSQKNSSLLNFQCQITTQLTFSQQTKSARYSIYKLKSLQSWLFSPKVSSVMISHCSQKNQLVTQIAM